MSVVHASRVCVSEYKHYEFMYIQISNFLKYSQLLYFHLKSLKGAAEGVMVCVIFYLNNTCDKYYTVFQKTTPFLFLR